jgi:hypothetical protein
MRVIVQLRPDAATELQRGEGAAPEVTEETKALQDAAAELKVRLEPLHPGQTHPLLSSYFMVEVPDQKTSEKVIDRLLRIPIVEAAYVKPDEQLP